MPRRATASAVQALRHAILAIIREHPAGISRPAVEAAYQAAHGKKLNYRTALRQLLHLTEEGLIAPVGNARDRTYRVIAPVGTVTPPEKAAPAETEPSLDAILRVASTEPGYPPVSPEGAEIRQLVREPRAMRKLSTYRPEFLEAYRPGVSWYLPEVIRSRLRELGRTPQEKQPAGTYARHILERLLVDLSYGSSHLEGNQYSMLDTKELLEHGREASGKTPVDKQMILNHKAAIEFLVEDAANLGFNGRTIVQLHALLSENLVGQRANEGQLRTRAVEIGDSVYTPNANPHQIREEFDRLLTVADAIPDPFEQSFFIMVHLPYLQPFIDVNKRTSRVAANLPLIKWNLCPLSFVDVLPVAYTEGTLGVYELRRIELLRDVYVWAYERSCEKYQVVVESLGQPDPIRLRYRGALRSVVEEAVQGLIEPDEAFLMASAQKHSVAAEDVAPFVESVRADFVDLRPELLKRYSLRPSELEAWQAMMASVASTSSRRA